jgi:hypothetical protein
MADLLIGEPNNGTSLGIEILSAQLVICLLIQMPASVQLDDKMASWTVEIDNIEAKWMLAVEFQTIEPSVS